MNTELDKMAALTEELAGYAEKLENQVAELQARISELDKQASEKTAASEETVEKVCSALVDAGCIEAGQVFQTKQAFLTDPEAIYRVVPKVLEAQTKKAAVEPEVDLNGGTLVGAHSQPKEDAFASSMERMQSILGII